MSADPHDEGGSESLEPESVGRASGLAPEPRRESLPARLVGFIRGSWRELQRVQWPDRRQTMQGTGVVAFFVIIAGAFLALADLISSHLVNLIVK